MVRRDDQAREALTGAPRTVVPHGEGPSSAGGRPLQTPSAPDTPTPPRYATEADIPALITEVERERDLRTNWFERCRDAEAECNVQRIRAEKAEAALNDFRGMVGDHLIHPIARVVIANALGYHGYGAAE